jgi:hypothetical protein
MNSVLGLHNTAPIPDIYIKRVCIYNTTEPIIIYLQLILERFYL